MELETLQRIWTEVGPRRDEIDGLLIFLKSKAGKLVQKKSDNYFAIQARPISLEFRHSGSLEFRHSGSPDS